MTSQFSSAVSTFRNMHLSGCFVMPNPWDRGSARCLEHLGFKALATTSAGLSFSRGLPDAVSSLSRDEVLQHIKDLVTSTSLPINADFQNGYADSPDEVAENIKLCIETGAAGLSIEDATGNTAQPLYARDLAVERIRAARSVIDATKSGVVLTARCESWLVGDPDPFHTAIDRLVAYAEAGADCLYAPGVRDTREIAAIVKAVSPKPVNVLTVSALPELSVERLGELGVRRISLGSALARVAWQQFLQAATSIAKTGTFDSIKSAATFEQLNDIFSVR